MNQLKLFIDLTRLQKPIGFMLLFWPCAWGLTLAYDFSKNITNYIYYLILFFLGAVLMRSAGCIVNDILDKEFDAKVLRTQNRPIASGKVSITQGVLYSIVLCFLALIVLLNFNLITIILALASMPFAFTYPLMKRFTYWPQLFLGITFNYGLLLGWTAVTNEINLTPIVLYIGAVFWTLGYDTIYGFQDIKDDEIIGLKSTSIKFKSNPLIFLSISYSILIISLIILGILIEFKLIYYVFLMFIGFQLYYYQIYKLNIKKTKSCLLVFKSNNFLGLLIFIALIIGKI